MDCIKAEGKMDISFKKYQQTVSACNESQQHPASIYSLLAK